MSNFNKDLGTFIMGVAATSALDSSGERIDIKGIDISSLAKDGIFNFEHHQNDPNQIVGKILEAKKILKFEDCENAHHEYFWRKVNEKPYLYVAGVLFDKFNHPGAISVAAMLKFDKVIDKSETKGTVNFSIEGTRLGEKQGEVIPGCIARRVTITTAACNKQCVAEIMEDSGEIKGLKKESLFDIFKKYEVIENDLSKADNNPKYNPKLNFKLKERPNKALTYKPITAATGEHRAGTAFDRKPAIKPMGDKIKTSQTSGGIRIHGPKKLETGIKGKDLYSKESTFQNQPKAKVSGPAKAGSSGISGNKLYNDPSTFKSEKFQRSNVRKAISASVGTGSSPSTLVNQVQKSFEMIIEDSWNQYNRKDVLIDFLKSEFSMMGELERMELAKGIAYHHTLRLESILEELSEE